MRPDGTVNRGALPAIINPDDLYALEEALKIRERVGGSVTALTMGPPAAVDVLKACLYRGADDAVLLTDRRFAGSDTLATSYVLKCAVETIGRFDLILCGRQAIDGDTAQVGPQLAEKLELNQVTYATEIIDISEAEITVKRSIENGHEIVKSRLPLLLTVSSGASEPRPPSVKRVMAYKNIGCKVCELAYENAYLEPEFCGESGFIREWNCESINADPDRCGIAGSPTRVMKVENIVLTPGESKQLPNSEAAMAELLQDLVDDHILT